jgi:hypothetical protein
MHVQLCRPQAGCATMAHFIGHEIDFVADEKSVIS